MKLPYSTISPKILRKGEKKIMKPEKQPRYEVVITAYYDIGIAVETTIDNKPKRVLAACYTTSISPKPYTPEYSGVKDTHWLHTGVYITYENWQTISCNKRFDQIYEELKLSEETITKLNPPKKTKTNETNKPLEALVTKLRWANVHEIQGLELVNVEYSFPYHITTEQRDIIADYLEEHNENETEKLQPIYMAILFIKNRIFFTVKSHFVPELGL